MENFLNRVAYLESTRVVKRQAAPLICQDVAKVFRDARDLGLTRPGEPAAGLPDMFALRSVDISLTLSSLGTVHRWWVDGLPPLLLPGPVRYLHRTVQRLCRRLCVPVPVPLPGVRAFPHRPLLSARVA
jgi:hypothetical protein